MKKLVKIYLGSLLVLTSIIDVDKDEQYQTEDIENLKNMVSDDIINKRHPSIFTTEEFELTHEII